MNHSLPTALVTGANKGIGLEIARQLARRGFRVFLGARDAGRGQDALEQLRAEEKAIVAAENLEFLSLDVADPASIARAAADLGARTGGRLDALVNNAAILEDEPGGTVLDLDPARLARTLETNLHGPLRLTQAVAGLLAAAPDGGRVVNLSSGLGQLHDMEAGYPAYSISKTALNALTRQLAAAFRARAQRVSVNTMCPGWVRTDMGGAGAERTVEHGADTAVWLATEAPADLTGRFFRDRQEIPW